MSRITSGWRGAKRILAAMPGSSGRRQHFELCALSGRGQTPVVGHDGLKVFADRQRGGQVDGVERPERGGIERHPPRSEEHTSELQSPCNLVCRLLLEKKKKN